jgi:hypothetical protein
VVLKEAQGNVGWLDSLKRGVVHGEGVRGRNICRLGLGTILMSYRVWETY